MATSGDTPSGQPGKPREPGREHEPDPDGPVPTSYQLDGGKGWAALMAGQRPEADERAPGRGGEARLTPETKELVDAIGAYFEQADRMSGIGEGRGRELGPSPALREKERQALGEARQRVERAIGQVRAQGRDMPERRPEPRVGDDTRGGDMMHIRIKAVGEGIQQAIRSLPDRDG